ncbi:hypothetical protein AtubIFM54640_003339 [Aspergillus tubingensis]|uniref:polygalacturonase n=1 Tax=Aspergillus tubingensis TaxID=5068 RepID=UPI001578D86F|nr:polygalacturonase [Aspergillus tubingensis]GFN14398.1 polygalacturonase [Aspergillus tubingensis]GLA57214.1 hypothetical protein AtubIFM54640_003339 [Aspergillus tubingensis]GLB13055.1 hypothetical protein AtubIFM61612_000452 [Aspergillus tubingensis]
MITSYRTWESWHEPRAVKAWTTALVPLAEEEAKEEEEEEEEEDEEEEEEAEESFEITVFDEAHAAEPDL